MWAGVSKSGSPISRGTISRPCRSSARARASPSKADSGPSRLIDGANLMAALSSCGVVAELYGTPVIPALALTLDGIVWYSHGHEAPGIRRGTRADHGHRRSSAGQREPGGAAAEQHGPAFRARSASFQQCRRLGARPPDHRRPAADRLASRGGRPARFAPTYRRISNGDASGSAHHRHDHWLPLPRPLGHGPDQRRLLPDLLPSEVRPEVTCSRPASPPARSRWAWTTVPPASAPVTECGSTRFYPPRP